MNSQINHLEVLVLTSVPKDGELTLSVLERAGLRGRLVSDVEDICDSVETAGAVVLSEECMSEEKLRKLNSSLSRQAVWSDIPIILVASGSGSRFDANNRLEWISKFLQNFTLLEKPIRLATLITVIRSSLLSRSKQFEQRRTLEELANSKKEADKASMAKTSFLANMSHEIRTPLSVITGFLELLKEGDVDQKDFQTYVDIIARNGEQLANLINDVLDLSKIEAGKIIAENRQVNLPDFLLDLSSLLGPMVKKEGLSFAFNTEEGLPSAIISDEGKIRQILINLVGNATKFTKKGSVEVTLKAEYRDDENVKISFSVKDSGVGIEKDKQGKLFAPFSQADDSVTREFGGTGLGLALSRRMAQALGGNVHLVGSEPGEGSHFEFYFISKMTNREIKSDARGVSEKGELEGMEILLAEDSKDNQYLVSEHLLGEKAKVDIANNGREAFDLAMAKEYDLVIMDIQMPIMDGLTATEKLRSENYQGPIIALTAHALKMDRDKSILAGFDAHLTKPIQGRTLVGAVKTYQNRGPKKD